METVSPKNNNSAGSSPYLSPNVGTLLKIKVISWSQETGLPVSVRVQLSNKIFNLHKLPLTSKSGYFKKRLDDTNEVELPQNFPGGPETFEVIALFIYDSSSLIDPYNVSALRCAAELLEMTERYGCGNLCERCDLYLNQIVLQSWDDTLIVLQKCQSLLPWSENLLIVSRCIESLAFMACMEILDPERRRDQPVLTLEALACQSWSHDKVMDISSQDLWIKDLIALPFAFFERIIGSLRRQGMKEKYVSPVIVLYANKWILSTETACEDDTNSKISMVLQGMIDLLPLGNKSGKVIPVGFYFAILAKSLEIRLKNDSKSKLQDQIASLLHFAQAKDFLLPEKGTDSAFCSTELMTMESIISTYVSHNTQINQSPVARNYMIAESWDAYLSEIAADHQMEAKRFMELIERVPVSFRRNHDQLYRAINSFLLAHPHISQEEKGIVCKYLNCQKLSKETCIDAVQNEMMPLRLIVQALFVQQLNTHQAFKECTDSFRSAHCGDFSGSLSSSIFAHSKSPNLGESSYTDGAEPASRPLSFFLQEDVMMQRLEISNKEYESTSFRIQTLEKELLSLKQSLQWHSKPELSSANSQTIKPYGMETRSLSKKRNPLGQVTACIGSVNFASQRKYASRILKIFRRITLFGNRKQRKKQGNTGQLSKSV